MGLRESTENERGRNELCANKQGSKCSCNNAQKGILPISEERELLIKLLKSTYLVRECLLNGGITFGLINDRLEESKKVIQEVEAYLDPYL